MARRTGTFASIHPSSFVCPDWGRHTIYRKTEKGFYRTCSMFTFREWAEFGVWGIPPGDVDWDYDPSRRYALPDQLRAKIDRIWEDEAEGNDNLYNGNVFNLFGVDGTVLRTGPAQFKDFFARYVALTGRGNASTASFTSEERRTLEESIHVLSSFCAVLSDDVVVLGIRNTDRTEEGEHLLSLPGSGYLDRDMDMNDSGEMHPTSMIIEREIREELNIDDRIAQIDCLGVYEDTMSESIYNPSLFSVVRTTRSPRDIRSEMTEAEDNWEFERLVFVSYDDRRLDTLLDVAFDVPGASIEIDGDELRSTNTSFSAKCVMMLLLLGRMHRGTSWFRERIRAHSDELQFVGQERN